MTTAGHRIRASSPSEAVVDDLELVRTLLRHAQRDEAAARWCARHVDLLARLLECAASANGWRPQLEAERRVVDALRRAPRGLRRADLAREAQLHVNSIDRIVSRLVEARRVERVGEGRSQRVAIAGGAS